MTGNTPHNAQQAMAPAGAVDTSVRCLPRGFSKARTLLVLATMAGGSIAVYAQATPEQSRGQLLYTTHCIACHTTQMHWRDDRLARDWDSLKVQVRRWQDNAGLQWGEADIAEVARHLNETIYHLPQTTGRVGVGFRRTAAFAVPDRPSAIR